MNGLFDDTRDPHPIRPESIDLSERLARAFGKREIELAATLLIQLCQQKQGWLPFYHSEFRAFLPDKNRIALLSAFEYLAGAQLILLCQDGKYRFTKFFIEQCAAMSASRAAA